MYRLKRTTVKPKIRADFARKSGWKPLWFQIWHADTLGCLDRTALNCAGTTQAISDVSGAYVDR